MKINSNKHTKNYLVTMLARNEKNITWISKCQYYKQIFLTMPSLEKLKFSKSAIKDGRIQILIQHCHCLVIITKSCQI